MGPRPLSQPIQFAKDWISVLTFRLLLSWRASSNTNTAHNGGGKSSTITSSANLMAADSHQISASAPQSGVSTPRSNSSLTAISQGQGQPIPSQGFGPIPAFFGGNSKTILDHFLKHYHFSGGIRKNGLFHSTLRSLLVLLESDINPADLPNKGTGSYQCDSNDYRKRYFIGNFAEKSPDGSTTGEKKQDDAEADEETVTLDEAVMKLKYLILGRLNLLAPARQSLLTAHRALLPVEFVYTWDEVALKNAQEAAAAALAAQASAKSSSAAVADICRSLRESYQQDGNHGGPSSSSPTGNSISIGSIDKLVAQQQQQPLAGARPLLSEGGRSTSGADNTAVLARRASGSTGGITSTTPYRAPSPDLVVIGAGVSPTTSPVRRSPMVSSGTPPRGTPPRMVDELSLNHPPTQEGNGGSASVGNSTGGGGSGSAASAFPRKLRDMMARISPTRPSSNGGPNTTSQSSSSTNGGAASQGSPAMVPTSYRSSPNNKTQHTATVFVGARNNSLVGSPNSSPPAMTSAGTYEPTVPALAGEEGSLTGIIAGEGNLPFTSPSSPNYNVATEPNSPATSLNNTLSPQQQPTHVYNSNTSGRVSPKLPPSKPTAEPPMRRRHLRATDSSERAHQEHYGETADGESQDKHLDEPEPLPVLPSSKESVVISTPSPSPSVSPASVMAGRILPVQREETEMNGTTASTVDAKTHVPQQPAGGPPTVSTPRRPSAPSTGSRPQSSTTDSGAASTEPPQTDPSSGSARFRHNQRPPSSGNTSPRSAPASASVSRTTSAIPSSAGASEKDKRGSSEPISAGVRAPTSPANVSNAHRNGLTNKNSMPQQTSSKRSNSAGPATQSPAPSSSVTASPRTRNVLASQSTTSQQSQQRTASPSGSARATNKNTAPTARK